MFLRFEKRLTDPRHRRKEISRRKNLAARGIQNFMTMTVRAFGTSPSRPPNPDFRFVCGNGKGASEFVF